MNTLAKIDQEDKILNPETGKYVKIKGPKGQKILYDEHIKKIKKNQTDCKDIIKELKKYGIIFDKSYNTKKIKSILKKWALKNHPDKGGDEEKFKEVRNLVSKFLEIGCKKNILFQDIVDMNNYCFKCTRTTKKKDISSLSYLINDEYLETLTQSEFIKLGIAVETILADIIVEKTSLLNIRPKNKKDAKEFDHLFKDDENKIIYYAELKSNLNLDTEKRKATVQKVKDNINTLKHKFKGYEIKGYLVGLRYTDKVSDKMKSSQYYKLKSIKDNILGVNQYFQILGIKDRFESVEQYANFINYIVKKCFFECIL